MSEHYYDKEANPQFKAGVVRARKENYLPSVTTVMKIIDKPGLNQWKQKQVLLAAANNPKNENESDREYENRILDESRDKSSSAANFGTDIHKAIEKFLNNGDLPSSQKVYSSFQSLNKKMDLISLNGKTEDTLVSKDYGFAGTVDWHGNYGGYAIIDWKTQDVKWKEYKKPTDDPYEIKKGDIYLRPNPVFYDEWPMQLWACGYMVTENYNHFIDKYISVVINSDPEHPEVIYIKEYDIDTILWAQKAFLTCLDLWRLIKKFPYKTL